MSHRHWHGGKRNRVAPISALSAKLASHIVQGIQQVIEAKGATVLYLRPTRPTGNPIELFLDKLKGALRTAAERSLDGRAQTIGALLDDFTPQECHNYLRHDGYASA